MRLWSPAVGEFRYPDYEIQFRVDFAKGGDPDLAVIELYNLAPETEQVFKKGEMVLRAGYQGDIGIVMAGEIRHVRVFDEAPIASARSRSSTRAPPTRVSRSVSPMFPARPDLRS